jgi:putative cardiolipin synthase
MPDAPLHRITVGAKIRCPFAESDHPYDPMAPELQSGPNVSQACIHTPVNALRILTVGLLLLVAAGCAQLPTGYDISETTALTDTDDTTLGIRAAITRHELAGETVMTTLVSGRDAFYARLVLADMAERSLDIQYFLWHKDLTGQVLLYNVLKAADRGVRVRILLDDLDNHALDQALYVLDQHPNISIRLFNPFPTRGFHYIDFLTDTARVNRRMHNKSFTADNQVTIVGGRNIGDEYFSAKTDSNFYDMDALATGPLVGEVSAAFDLYWNHETAVPVYAFEQNDATPDDIEKLREELRAYTESHRDSQYAKDVRSSQFYKAMEKEGDFPVYVATATVYFDDPGKGLGKTREEVAFMNELLRPYFDNLDHELVIITPYFVPGDDGVQKALDMIKRGISVVVITNSYGSTDNVAVHAGYSRFREALLAGGVKIYELKVSAKKPRQKDSVAYSSGASLHAKSFIFDEKFVFIGSLNMDPRSIDINTEMGIVFHSPELARALVSALDRGELENMYELELVTTPAKITGEFATDSTQIVWIERKDGEVIRHTDEPGIDAWESIKLFFAGMAPESQI